MLNIRNKRLFAAAALSLLSACNTMQDTNGTQRKEGGSVVVPVDVAMNCARNAGIEGAVSMNYSYGSGAPYNRKISPNETTSTTQAAIANACIAQKLGAGGTVAQPSKATQSAAVSAVPASRRMVKACAEYAGIESYSIARGRVDGKQSYGFAASPAIPTNALTTANRCLTEVSQNTTAQSRGMFLGSTGVVHDYASCQKEAAERKRAQRRSRVSTPSTAGLFGAILANAIVAGVGNAAVENFFENCLVSVGARSPQAGSFASGSSAGFGTTFVSGQCVGRSGGGDVFSGGSGYKKRC